MTIRVEEGKDVFELNIGLSAMFPNLTCAEMEYVIHVCDSQSVFKTRTEEDKRKFALKLCDGLWEKNKPTSKGQKILDRKNKDVEMAILLYRKEINNNKFNKIAKTLDVLSDYLDAQLDFIKSLNNAEDTDEKVKIYNATAKSIKDETLKSTYDQIKFFEKELSFEYQVPDDVMEDTKEERKDYTNTADSIDVNAL